MQSNKAMRKGVSATPTSPNTKKTPLIDMKAAVQSAIAFAQEMLPDAKDIRLEEVEPSSGGGWSVVISYATNQSSTFAVLRGEEGSRSYKKIAIDSETGRPQSLKVWK